MSEKLFIEGVEYIKTRAAAAMVGYTNDYVSRLAREKKIRASRLGRQWFVDPFSLQEFAAAASNTKRSRTSMLRRERKVEHKENVIKRETAPELVVSQFDITRGVPHALVSSFTICITGVAFGALGYLGLVMPDNNLLSKQTAQQVAIALYTSVSGIDAPQAESEVSLKGQTKSEALVGESAHPDMRQNGLLVMEGTTSDEVVAAIRDTFSDEVVVTIDETQGDTGLITPVFREREGDSYRFLMVPVPES